MTLPARNRPPPPMPGSPEAIQAEEDRNRIITEAKGSNATAMTAQASQPLAVQTNALAPLPDLPSSNRLRKIPRAEPAFNLNSRGQKEYDLEKLPSDTGGKPADRVPHDFGGNDGKNGQPDWLNDGSLGGGAVCKVCGVSVRTDLVRADRKGMKYHYVDAYGIALTSMVELFCPTFLGDVPGAVGEAKQRVRHLDVQMETVHDRLDRLEADNQYLREQLEAKIQLDVDSLVAWLGQMAKMAATAQLPMAPVTVAGLGLEIPAPIADLVRGVGEAAKVTVDIVVEDPDPEDAE